MRKNMVYYFSISILFLIITLFFSYKYLDSRKYERVDFPNQSASTNDKVVSESIEEFFDRTECKESTDGCFLCRRSDSGEINCSTAGFACIQKELVCKSR